MSRLLSSVIALTFVGLPAQAGAQTVPKGVPVEVYCLEHGGQQFFIGPCTSEEACAVLHAAHMCDVHQKLCDQNSGGGRTLTPRPPSGPVEAVVRGTIVGSLTGALLGSLADEATNGAIGGAGVMTAIYAAAAPKINPVVRAVIAAGGGAAAGNAWARYQIRQGKPDTTQRDTAIGAAAGAAVGFLGGFNRGKYGDTPSKPLSPAVVYVAALGAGAGAGAAAGQAWKTPAGDPQVAVGSLGGAAASSTLALLAKGGDMSWAGATFAGALSGAAGGAAYGKWDTDRGNEDRMAMYAGIGAATGAAIGFLVGRAGGGSRPQSTAPAVPRGRSIDAIFTGRYAGAVVRW